MLRSLNDAFRENCRRLRPGPVPRFRPLRTSPLSLGSILAEVLEEEKAAAPSVAAPVVDKPAQEAELPRKEELEENTPEPITPEQAVMARVAEESRLAIEHPQMWKYGPVFPRAYKRGSIEDLSVCAESYHQLMEKEPAQLTRLSTKTQAMMATSMADLNAVHKGARSPYGKMVAKYPDKWGVQIPDEER